MDKFRQIEAFVTAVDQGSLSKAAEFLSVTPAMVGRRIDALEQRLGVALLQRTTRQLTLTELGDQFLEASRKILSQLERAEESVSGENQKLSGHLSVYTPAAFGRLHILPHVAGMISDHPDLTMSFNLTSASVDLIRDRYDLGIHIRGKPDPGLVSVKLASNRKVVCGTPEYFRKHGVPRVPTDLLAHNCFPYKTNRDQSWAWTFQVDGKLLALKVDGNMGYNGGEFITRWCLDGLGLGWRSTWEIQDYLTSGQLVSVLDEFAPPEYDIQAVYAPSQHLSSRIRFFVSRLQAIYGRPGYWHETMASDRSVSLGS
jgi:DNA-binding transcriptional LysR family regulator